MSQQQRRVLDNECNHWHRQRENCAAPVKWLQSICRLIVSSFMSISLAMQCQTISSGVRMCVIVWTIAINRDSNERVSVWRRDDDYRLHHRLFTIHSSPIDSEREGEREGEAKKHEETEKLFSFLTNTLLIFFTLFMLRSFATAQLVDTQREWYLHLRKKRELLFTRSYTGVRSSLSLLIGVVFRDCFFHSYQQHSLEGVHTRRAVYL